MTAGHYASIKNKHFSYILTLFKISRIFGPPPPHTPEYSIYFISILSLPFQQCCGSDNIEIGIQILELNNYKLFLSLTFYVELVVLQKYIFKILYFLPVYVLLLYIYVHIRIQADPEHCLPPHYPPSPPQHC